METAKMIYANVENGKLELSAESGVQQKESVELNTNTTNNCQC